MSDIPVLTPVRPAHRFDEPALERYLRAELPGFPRGASLTVRQFEGGQSNPTFLLEAGGASTSCASSRRASSFRPPTRSTASTGS